MKLDNRIIDGKKPLDCFDTEIAKEFIGKKGLFGTYDSQFANLDTCPKCLVDELKSVDDYDDYPFITSRNHGYRLFLPAEWVKEPEKKYRPLNKDEFIRMFNNGVFGQWVTLKNIVDNKESCFQIVGYFHAPDDTFAVCFGSHEFSLQTLFDYYRWKDYDGNWRVFGVEV